MIIVSIFLFVLGAAMGSFALATVWRIHHQIPLGRERSECEYCHHVLGPADLVPVISWLWLKGRCRYCHHSITADHLYVEIISGLIFVTSYLWWPEALSGWQLVVPFVFWLAYVMGGMMLFLYDLRWRLLPDKVLFPMIVLSVIGLVVNDIWLGGQGVVAVKQAMGGIVILAGFFGLLYTVSGGRWIGFGDVKLGVFMGIVLGFPAALIALMSTYYIAVLVILPLLITKKVTRKSYVPFGPFLLVSFFVSYFLATPIIQWITLG